MTQDVKLSPVPDKVLKAIELLRGGIEGIGVVSEEDNETVTPLSHQLDILTHHHSEREAEFFAMIKRVEEKIRLGREAEQLASEIADSRHT